MTNHETDRRETVEYFLQTQQPDDTWSDSSSRMDDVEWARECLATRRQKMPQWEHRIVWRATSLAVGVLEEGAAAVSVPPPADQAAEIQRLRTENARMRHELEVMYGGAFDSLPPAASGPVAGEQQNETPEAEAQTTTKPEPDTDRDTLRRQFGDVLRHWGLLDEQIDQKAAEDAAVADLLALLPEQTSRDAEIEHLRDRLASCRERVGIAADKAIAAEDVVARARRARRRLTSALIAVEPLLTEPYPDDPRWTPWTRFVGPALKELSDALKTGPAANDEPAAGVRQDGAPPQEPSVVAYRSDGGRLLNCLRHVPPPAARHADFHPVTAEDLPDGGICTYPDCGRDVLAEPHP